MKKDEPGLYMFFGSAVADSEESGYEPGERHAVIGFAMSQKIDDAARIAAEHFLDAGWTDVSFDEGQEFELERLDGIEDDDVANTCRECLATGSSGIVFRPVVGQG